MLGFESVWSVCELSSLSLELLMLLTTLGSKLWEICIMCSTKADKDTYVKWKAKETRECVFKKKIKFKWLFSSLNTFL